MFLITSWVRRAHGIWRERVRTRGGERSIGQLSSLESQWIFQSLNYLRRGFPTNKQTSTLSSSSPSLSPHIALASRHVPFVQIAAFWWFCYRLLSNRSEIRFHTEIYAHKFVKQKCAERRKWNEEKTQQNAYHWPKSHYYIHISCAVISNLFIYACTLLVRGGTRAPCASTANADTERCVSVMAKGIVYTDKLVNVNERNMNSERQKQRDQNRIRHVSRAKERRETTTKGTY